MKFKEIFDREILTEEHVRKGLKIFYELDLELIKTKAPQLVQQAQNQDTSAAQPQQTQEFAPPSQSVPIPQQQNVNEPVQQPEQTSEIQDTGNPDTATQDQGTNISAADFKASVVTEDEVSEITEERIVRKFDGTASLSDSEKDNIQSFEDVVDILANIKKNGTQILDEFSVEIINLCLQQNYAEIKNKIDKKSKIFVEIYYGYKKDDSVGLRFSKRPNSDMMTSTMLLDNEIISSKFNIEKINQQVVEYRNYDVNK